MFAALNMQWKFGYHIAAKIRYESNVVKTLVMEVMGEGVGEEEGEGGMVTLYPAVSSAPSVKYALKSF